MTISIFQLFTIGLGPSSSHTVGPMKAAVAFQNALESCTSPEDIKRIQIELFGSLAYTGKGHGTDYAILVGLEGHLPDRVDPELVKNRPPEIISKQELRLFNQHVISFDYLHDFIFNFSDLLPLHTNGMRFSAYGHHDECLLEKIFYSIGGGFIIDHATPKDHEPTHDVPYPFNSAKALLEQCELHQLSIAELMLKNECSFRPKEEVYAMLYDIAATMQECIERGCIQEGVLPGGLNIPRRAPELYKRLFSRGKPSSKDMTDSLDWLNLYALSVNEENAAGGRVVTAPTNGAAGIIPSVLYYYLNFYPSAKKEDILSFLLTAGAIAILYKKNASISGAEVGCQGEVGVACSMAAAALTAVLGGSLYQIENAAEIAMEHHLGLTCDPIQGLVQVPCIERNAMGAMKALNASRLALLGDGQHFVSLDKVIATMKQTGKDMQTIYKETSQGGLAANLPEC